MYLSIGLHIENLDKLHALIELRLVESSMLILRLGHRPQLISYTVHTIKIEQVGGSNRAELSSEKSIHVWGEG